jgi:hypothetical protein
MVHLHKSPNFLLRISRLKLFLTALLKCLTYGLTSRYIMSLVGLNLTDQYSQFIYDCAVPISKPPSLLTELELISWTVSCSMGAHREHASRCTGSTSGVRAMDSGTGLRNKSRTYKFNQF